MNLSYLLLAIPFSIAVELFVVSGCWARLAEWWRKQTALYVEDDDDYEITHFYSMPKGGPKWGGPR